MNTPQSSPAPPIGPVTLRIPSTLAARIRTDLARPHPFASERVGFVTVATGEGEDGELVLIAAEYHPVANDHYVVSPGVGARIGLPAIREAVNRACTTGLGVLHVHLHDHKGIPEFSAVDAVEQPRLVDSFRAVARDYPHGMLVLSSDAANAWIWQPRCETPIVPGRLTIVGYPMVLLTGAQLRLEESHLDEEAPRTAGHGRYARQAFLGWESQGRIRSFRVGVIGYGGGGSHIGQQIAHLGFEAARIADPDLIDESNLNRLIGGIAADVAAQVRKTTIAQRTIKAIHPVADLRLHSGIWQERPRMLRDCDIVVGCVDSFVERHELEVLCRRYCIPYIDIGMDVHHVGVEAPRMGGQVILSMPGQPCLRCVGFLTEERLDNEAARYGAAGDRPQVVWPNGILASSAVGILVDLVTGWTRARDRVVYLSYDGNTGTLTPHVRLRYLSLGRGCPHFPEHEVGTPTFRPL